jgi:hypothetical protein
MINGMLEVGTAVPATANKHKPTPVDVAVDAIGNSGVSDGETVLDITVSSSTLEVGIFKHPGANSIETAMPAAQEATNPIGLLTSFATSCPGLSTRRAIKAGGCEPTATGSATLAEFMRSRQPRG